MTKVNRDVGLYPTICRCPTPAHARVQPALAQPIALPDPGFPDSTTPSVTVLDQFKIPSSVGFVVIALLAGTDTPDWPTVAISVGAV